jgi:hypothetical protein
LPPRCREECEELRADLRRTEDEAIQRTHELDSELEQCRVSFEDLRIEYEDVDMEEKQWIEWHDEATDELVAAQHDLASRESAFKHAVSFASASFAQVCATDREAA